MAMTDDEKVLFKRVGDKLGLTRVAMCWGWARRDSAAGVEVGASWDALQSVFNIRRIDVDPKEMLYYYLRIYAMCSV